MDTKTVKLFDNKNNLVPNFDEEIEKILISVHGESYYDVDEDLINTNLIPVSAYLQDIQKDDELDKTIELVDSMVSKDSPKINIVNNDEKKKISFKDFLPVLFFIIIFIIIVAAGYYFLNTVDLLSFLK